MSNTTLGVYFLQALEKILTCLHLGSHYFCIYTSCKSKFILCLPIQSRPFKMQILFLLGAWRLYRCWALMNSPLYKIYSILTLKEIRLKNIYSFERQIEERRKREKTELPSTGSFRKYFYMAAIAMAELGTPSGSSSVASRRPDT